MDENKKIEVVKGDGSNLEISPAYDHLNAGTPSPASKKPKDIIVPKSIKEKDKSKTNEDEKEYSEDNK